MRDFDAASLSLHAATRGKLDVTPTCEIETADDLSTVYTPGVAAPSKRIAEHPDDAYRYTIKSRTVAVVSNGSAVLGLGNIGPTAALPVMEGKCALIKRFGGIDAFPICIDATTPSEIVAATRAIAPTFGAINLEDIASPVCFDAEAALERELDIPVFHDDQHGTAIVVTAALENALEVVGKKLGEVKIVLSGTGAAGTAIIKMLHTAGAGNIIGLDSHGAIHPGRDHLNRWKEELASITNPDGETGGLAEVIRGADVFIGTSKPGILNADMVRTMSSDPVVFAMANPVPEISCEEAVGAGAAVMATGRSDTPNQVNNLLAFPGVFKGALAVRARDITPEMKLAAAHAIAGLVSDDERRPDYVIPSALEPRVAGTVALAVAEAAISCGTARAPQGITEL